MRGNGIYGFWSYNTRHSQPDWQFFERVSLYDPFFIERTEYTFGTGLYGGAMFNVSERVDVLEMILNRYTDGLKEITFEQFEALRPLGKVMLKAAEACRVSSGPKDEKEFGDRLYEILHRLQTEWGITKMSSVSTRLASKQTVKDYLLAAYMAGEDEIDKALSTSIAGRYVSEAVTAGSYAYYPGDQIAQFYHWNENPDFTEEDDDEED